MPNPEAQDRGDAERGEGRRGDRVSSTFPRVPASPCPPVGLNQQPDCFDHTHPNATTRPNHIELEHWHEWVNDSAVHPLLTSLSPVSLSGSKPHERLLYALPPSERRNDGRLRDKWLRRYAHCEQGGWWCSGVDVLTGEDADWGQFKPNKPYHYQEKPAPKGFGSTDKVKNKVIRYEPPRNVPTEITALPVPLHLWQAIASRYDVPLPDDIVVTPSGRALGFWAWVIESPQIPLIVTEGAKKAGAIITAGYVALSLPGIFNGYRQPLFNSPAQNFCSKESGDNFRLR